ncbi:MAG TPA: ferredoxin, partial [Bacteroidales bacterium]|nr:ferredoxin [Bacteroidales bacterium]
MITENEITRKTVRRVAEKMILAARTAPKARGTDNLILAIAEKEDIQEIAEKMKEIGQRINAAFFLRDAENI